jgi:SRSO17 transposase
LAYAAGDFHCLLDGELFLPESWDQDRERCRRAKIPDDVVHRPKWQIALGQRDRAVANGIHLDWVTFDEGYPMNPEFLFALDDRGQHYVGEVKRTFTGWLERPGLLYKRHPRAKGPTGHFPRLKKKDARPISVENMLKYSPRLRKIPWERFHIKDTEKGPMVWEAKAARIYLRRNGLPTWPHWLVIARNVENPEEIKFFIAHAPAGTPLEVLLHVGFSRWHVERCFQDEKTELGLSHFEVRNYQSLQRHLIVTSVTQLFLAETCQQERGQKSGTDRLPSSNGQFGAGPFPVGVRPCPQEILGESGGCHHETAGSESPVATVPSEEEDRAVA